MRRLTGELPVNLEGSRTSNAVNVSSDPRAAQVEKILHSQAFRNTEVLKRLLDYLVRQALRDPAGEIKEYTVGVEAFGKPQDYDPRTDSSVRVQVGKLRQKLDEYYRTEGADDALVVLLPKGHFRVEFGSRIAAAPAPVEPHPRRGWLAGAAVLVLVMLAAIWWARPASPVVAERWNPEMEALWKPLLASPRPLMVAIGTPLFTKMGNDFFRAPGLNTWDAASQSEDVRKVEKALGTGPLSAAFPYTGVGEAEGAFALQRLLLPRGRDLAMQASNLLTWEDITRYNMIFLGPPKFNLQTVDLPMQQDFEISHSRVNNLRPRQGEPTGYDEKWGADRATLVEGHALITRIPGLHRNGEMLILAGSSTECTRAAVEYVTRPEYVTPLVRFLRQQQGGIPDWFQLVVRAQFKSQTPIAIERVAFHALQ